MSSEWPSFYPLKIAVPPEDAVCSQGPFFRLVLSSPPQEHCFLSTHEEQPNRYKKCSGVALQNVYGASFFDNKVQAAAVRDKFPDVLGQRIVAEGTLVPEVGKMKQTFSPGHYTVWIRLNSAPINEFSTCE
jgi:hypothetical protein